VLAAFVLMFLGVYAPGVGALLHTVPPTGSTLAMIAVAAAVPGLVVRLLAVRSR